MAQKPNTASHREWVVLALINSLVTLCEHEDIPGIGDILDQDIRDNNVNEIMSRLWILNIRRESRYDVWRTLIDPREIDEKDFDLNPQNLDNRIHSAWGWNGDLDKAVRCVKVLLRDLVVTRETWEECEC
jgi:hypothetical protein